MYLIGGIILYKIVNYSTIDLQFLDRYRRGAAELVHCVPSSCSQFNLKNGLLYYIHWADFFRNGMEGYNAAGYCFYHLHEYRHAFEYFSHAINLDPKNSTLYYNQALALLNLGEYPQALAVLKHGSAFFSANTFFNPHIILPFKNSLEPDGLDQPAVVLNLALFEYGELISLTQQIVNTSDHQQKNDLINKLHQKINALELYYYVPIYKATVQGKEIVMI